MSASSVYSTQGGQELEEHGAGLRPGKRGRGRWAGQWECAAQASPNPSRPSRTRKDRGGHQPHRSSGRRKHEVPDGQQQQGLGLVDGLGGVCELLLRLGEEVEDCPFEVQQVWGSGTAVAGRALRRGRRVPGLSAVAGRACGELRKPGRGQSARGQARTTRASPSVEMPRCCDLETGNNGESVWEEEDVAQLPQVGIVVAQARIEEHGHMTGRCGACPPGRARGEEGAAPSPPSRRAGRRAEGRCQIRGRDGGGRRPAGGATASCGVRRFGAP